MRGSLTIQWKFLSWTHEILPWGGIPPRLGTTSIIRGFHGKRNNANLLDLTSSLIGFGDNSILTLVCVSKTIVCVFSLNLALVFHYFTHELCLKITGMKMCKWNKIDFLVKHFVSRFRCIALVEICTLMSRHLQYSIMVYV